MKTNNAIKSSFAGIEIANPIIVSSCSLTSTAKSNGTLAAAGVGAIVLKSLFEEDIIHQSALLSQDTDHSEAADYMQAYMSSSALSGYIDLIRESKETCGATPIIASINCSNSGEWVNYARAIEQAGADALELNIMSIESDRMGEDGALEQRHIAIAKAVSAAVEMPIIMKLGSQISNHISLISRLMACGISGFVLFNRTYPLDIDIDAVKYTSGAILTSSSDLATPLRHVAITTAAEPKASLALSGGVAGGSELIKSILAGAAAVEVSSILYTNKNRTEWVASTLATLEQWQAAHGYTSIEEMRGLVSKSGDEQSDSALRVQFSKHFGAY